MAEELTIKIRVPGTTANIGPGFDCLGAALTIYNYFTFSNSATTTFTVRGTEAAGISTDENNLVYKSFLKLYQYLDRTPPQVAIDIELGVPLARGLGSSATAIVGGLIGANQLAGSPLNIQEVMELAIAIEGHPDNVVPALLGNCQLSVGETGNWQICQLPWHPELVPVVAIPNFELSTEAARSVLPKQLDRGDAIFNIARMGLLVKGIESDRGDWLTVAMEDRLHQPYRQELIKGYTNVKQAAIDAGAYGMVISGAGPTLLALVNISKADAVATAMAQAWQQEGILVRSVPLSIDSEGAKW